MKSTNKDTIAWKKVDIENSSLKDQGLVLFEECTDYTLVTSSASSLQKRKSNEESTHKNQRKAKRQKSAIESSAATETVITPSKQGSTHNKPLEHVNSPKLEEAVVQPTNYSAWDNFGLPESILKAIHELGFEQPTEIQSLSLPAAILGRRDIIGAAETGSGKTLAFGLPILTGILRHKKEDQQKGKLFALILTPTRELAMQVQNHLKAVAKFTDIKIALVVGGLATVKQERILKMAPEIVVGTPGRLWELIQQGNEHLSQFDTVKYFVIDETDRMLEKDHFEEIHSLLERLNQSEASKTLRQNFVFSATLTLVHELPKYITNKSKKRDLTMTPQQKLDSIVKTLGISNPKIVDLSEGTGTSQTLTESKISCKIEEKDYYVYYFLKRHPGRTLIFCNSIGCVRRLTHLLDLLQCKPMALHASMQQRQRFKNLERFRDDPLGVLVATDVAARGLDIPKVEHVLHYQTPRTSESYVHRSGRTARASNQGITVVLIEPSEVRNYIKLCKTLKKEEDLPAFPVLEDYFKSVQERVDVAREVDKMDLEVKKVTAKSSWFKKAAEEMDIIVDVEDDGVEAVSSTKKQANAKRKHLNALLNRPIMSREFSGKFPLLPGNTISPLPVPKDAVSVMKEALDKPTKRHAVKIYNRKKFNKKK